MKMKFTLAASEKIKSLFFPQPDWHNSWVEQLKICIDYDDQPICMGII